MDEKIVKDSQGLAKDLVNDCISRHGVSAWLDNMGYPRLADTVMDENRFPPAQQWIPCSERLPFAEYGESDNVLTTCGYRDVKDTRVRWIRLLYFNGGNWCYPTGKTYEQKVYAWMPLPEPYKEDDHDNT